MKTKLFTNRDIQTIKFYAQRKAFGELYSNLKMKNLLDADDTHKSVEEYARTHYKNDVLAGTCEELKSHLISNTTLNPADMRELRDFLFVLFPDEKPEDYQVALEVL